MTASAEHAVAEKRQARVGVAAPLAPRGVREDLSRQVVGEFFQQRGEQLHRAHRTSRRSLGEDEVHRLADREDLRGLLVGHAHAVGVLELLHERVQVQRVGLQILLEARRVADRRGVHVEFVGQVGLDQREHLLARLSGHPRTPTRATARARHGASSWAGSCSFGVRQASVRRGQGSLPERPRARQRTAVCPTMSSRAPRCARRIASAKPVREKRPCGTTPRRRSPSR